MLFLQPARRTIMHPKLQKIGLPGNSIFGRLAIKVFRSDRCEAER